MHADDHPQKKKTCHKQHCSWLCHFSLLIVNYNNEQIILPLFTLLLLCCGCNTSKKSASPDLDEFLMESCVCGLVLGFWWFAHAWFMLSQDADSNQPFFVRIVISKETEAKQLSIRSVSSTFCPPHELKVHHLPGMSCSRKLHQFWEFWMAWQEHKISSCSTFLPLQLSLRASGRLEFCYIQHAIAGANWIEEFNT